MMSATYGKKDGLDYELLYNYLHEKLNEDRKILELTKEILNREDFFLQKTRLIEMEHQLLLIQKQNG